MFAILVSGIIPLLVNFQIMVIQPSHKHFLNLQYTVYCCQFIGIPMLAHSVLTQVSGATLTLCDLLAGTHFRIPLPLSLVPQPFSHCHIGPFLIVSPVSQSSCAVLDANRAVTTLPVVSFYLFCLFNGLPQLSTYPFSLFLSSCVQSILLEC